MRIFFLCDLFSRPELQKKIIYFTKKWVKISEFETGLIEEASNEGNYQLWNKFFIFRHLVRYHQQ
jgi:hypothetical protein